MGDVYVTCQVGLTTVPVPCVVHIIPDIPPFQLDTAGGALIASAILAVWAVGFGVRAIIRALSLDGKPNSESDL